MTGVVLIAGVSRFLGSRLAAQLAGDPSIERVIGIDTVPPPSRDLPLLGRTEFVRADIRNPLIAKVIAQGGVTTVVHAALMAPGDFPGGAPGARAGRMSMQEMNVIGTMQLLAACQKSETVQRVVLRSTTAVYGSHPGDPAVFTEDTRGRESVARGFPKDAAEVEGYVRGFGRRRPDVGVSVLRLAQLIGPTVDTALTRYLRLPVVPTIAGFDPRLQLLHENDAVEVLRLATVSERPGTVNVAGDGVLSLAQLVRRAGRVRVSVPGPAAGLAGALLRNSGARDLAAEEFDFLRYGRVVDTTRLREEFGYEPQGTAEAADSFLRTARPAPRLALAALGVGSGLLQARRAAGSRLIHAARPAGTGA
jgi:UDP-glucose 4-epimerase